MNSKSKGHNSAKNYSAGTKFELDLHNLHDKPTYQISIQNVNVRRDNERNLNNDGSGQYYMPQHFMLGA